MISQFGRGVDRYHLDDGENFGCLRQVGHRWWRPFVIRAMATPNDSGRVALSDTQGDGANEDGGYSRPDPLRGFQGWTGLNRPKHRKHHRCSNLCDGQSAQNGKDMRCWAVEHVLAGLSSTSLLCRSVMSADCARADPWRLPRRCSTGRYPVRGAASFRDWGLCRRVAVPSRHHAAHVPARGRRWVRSEGQQFFLALERITHTPQLAGREGIWRRERDSNPRYAFTHTRFPSVRLKPLGHLSSIRGRNDRLR
jgi:hypothetical protein